MRRFLPMTPEETGGEPLDVVLITGDAYVDHPSWGVSAIGRWLEAHGFSVGVIAQPDWTDLDHFQALGPPNLFFGITAGNMDSMVNRYTADRRIRRDDAYTPGGVGGKRPDRSVIVYAQRAREAEHLGAAAGHGGQPALACLVRLAGVRIDRLLHVLLLHRRQLGQPRRQRSRRRLLPACSHVPSAACHGCRCR